MPASKFQSQARLGKSASCFSFPFLAPPLDSTCWLQRPSSLNHNTTPSQGLGAFHSNGSTKPLPTRMTSPCKRPRSLPAPVTVWPGRSEKQFSLGGAADQYSTVRQSGTNQPYTECKVRLREGDVKYDGAPVLSVTGANWSIFFMSEYVLCYSLLVLMYANFPLISL